MALTCSIGTAARHRWSTSIPRISHRYLSVCFDNRSQDIRDLFIDACDLVGVRCRPNGASVRIYRRDDVAQFAAFVGAKW